MAARDQGATEAAGDYVIESGAYAGVQVRHLDKAGLERIAKVGAGKRGSTACREAKAWAALWAARTDVPAPPQQMGELAQLVMVPSTKTKLLQRQAPETGPPQLWQVRSWRLPACRSGRWVRLVALCLLPCLMWPKLARVPVRASAKAWACTLRQGGRLAGMVIEEYWLSTSMLSRELWELVDNQLDAWLGADPAPLPWELSGPELEPEPADISAPHAQPLAAAPIQPSTRGITKLLDRVQALGQAFVAGLGAALSLLVCALASQNTNMN